MHTHTHATEGYARHVILPEEKQEITKPNLVFITPVRVTFALSNTFKKLASECLRSTLRTKYHFDDAGERRTMHGNVDGNTSTR